VICWASKNRERKIYAIVGDFDSLVASPLSSLSFPFISQKKLNLRLRKTRRHKFKL